jgi:flagellin
MRKALRSLDQLGISGASIASKAGAQVAIGRVDEMISKVSASRAELGSIGNRMESTVNNLMISKESSEAAKSQIRDTDMAIESANSASLQIREQATTSLLTNANKLSSSVMRLLS